MTDLLVILFLLMVIVGMVGLVATYCTKPVAAMDNRPDNCSCTEWEGSDEWCPVHGSKRTAGVK